MTLDTQSESVLDYVPSYCQEVQVESVVITQYVENELENMSDENDHSLQCDAQDTKTIGPEDTKNCTEVSYEGIESLGLHTVEAGLDERSEKQDPVKDRVLDIEAAAGGEKFLTPHEETGVEAADLVSLYMIKQSFVKLDRLDLSGRQFSKTLKPGAQKRVRDRPKKDPQNKTSCRKKEEVKKVPCTSINKYA